MVARYPEVQVCRAQSRPGAAGERPDRQRLRRPQEAGRAPAGQLRAAAASGHRQRHARTVRAARGERRRRQRPGSGCGGDGRSGQRRGGRRRRGSAAGLPAAAVVAPREHVLEGGVQRPVAAAAGTGGGVGAAGQAAEAGVEAEVVADAVLPALGAAAVVGEAARDVGVDAAEGEPLLGAGPDGHGDQSHVGVGRLLQPLRRVRAGHRRRRSGVRLPHGSALPRPRRCPSKASPPRHPPPLPGCCLGSRAGRDVALASQTQIYRGAGQRQVRGGGSGAEGKG